jgi:hypothetical protein
MHSHRRKHRLNPTQRNKINVERRVLKLDGEKFLKKPLALEVKDKYRDLLQQLARGNALSCINHKAEQYKYTVTMLKERRFQHHKPEQYKYTVRMHKERRFQHQKPEH